MAVCELPMSAWQGVRPSCGDPFGLPKPRRPPPTHLTHTESLLSTTLYGRLTFRLYDYSGGLRYFQSLALGSFISGRRRRSEGGVTLSNLSTREYTYIEKRVLSIVYSRYYCIGTEISGGAAKIEYGFTV